MSYYYGGPGYYTIPPYPVDYPLLPPAPNYHPPSLNQHSHYDYYSDYSSSDEVYNSHPYPTRGRPLGRIHRAAEAEGITLRHIQGCHRAGRCERMHAANMRAELRRLGQNPRRLTIRQALRVVRGFPAGEPDHIPRRDAGQQSSSGPGQQQQQPQPQIAAAAPTTPATPAAPAAPASVVLGGAFPGGNAFAGAMPQPGAGGGQFGGMMGGGGGFAGNHSGGMNGPQGWMNGGGQGGMGGPGGMVGMGGSGRRRRIGGPGGGHGGAGGMGGMGGPSYGGAGGRHGDMGYEYDYGY
ncbi:MAG: hypothetical protein Q9186_003029 [Xanthomendoza sp. 1 TL-2023]